MPNTPPDHQIVSLPQAFPFIVWRVDRRLILKDYQGEASLLPIPAGEALGQSLEAFCPDALLQVHYQALRGVVASYEQSLAGRTYLITVSPEYDARRQIVGGKAVALDVSAYKAAERTAAVLRSQAESILHAAGEGIYGLNLDGKASFVNPAAERMTGWSAEETIGKTIHYLHHHSHEDGTPYPHEECPIYAAIKDGEVHHVEDEVFWRKDGGCFPVEYTSTPIYNQGKLAGAVVVFKDTSERKKAQRELLTAFEEVARLKEQLQEQNTYLQEELREDKNFGQIIGTSAAVRTMLKKVEQVANTNVTVLILGESGTGKELIARAVHDHSGRGNMPLVKVNCGAISAGLVESELFGHEKGAFTGAHERRKGRFELADGGTLLLDEVGELPLETQVKLLRVLQEQEFERIGSSTSIKVDVRIIAATNRDLAQRVAEGTFRRDLFYRLNVFPIDVPPLREREGDIPLLARHFLERAARKFGKPLRDFNSDSLAALQRYSWPGNIRELQNVIERAAILATGNSVDVSGLLPKLNPLASNANLPTLDDVERAHIQRVLEHTSGVIAGPKGAAMILGMHPNTLRSRMIKLGITD